MSRPRVTWTLTLSPIFFLLINWIRCELSLTFTPLKWVMMSPGLISAFSAAVPGVTESTSTPAPW